MLFICIKLQSDSVKLISGISLASAGTAGSSGTVSQEPPRAPIREGSARGACGGPKCPQMSQSTLVLAVELPRDQRRQAGHCQARCSPASWAVLPSPALSCPAQSFQGSLELPGCPCGCPGSGAVAVSCTSLRSCWAGRGSVLGAVKHPGACSSAASPSCTGGTEGVWSLWSQVCKSDIKNK